VQSLPSFAARYPPGRERVNPTELGLRNVEGPPLLIELQRESNRGGMPRDRGKFCVSLQAPLVVERSYAGGKLEEFPISQMNDGRGGTVSASRDPKMSKEGRAATEKPSGGQFRIPI
jgi:hypothetical protein